MINITGCDKDPARFFDDIRRAVDLHYTQKAETVILGRCTQETLDLARMSGGWDFPVFARDFLTPSYYSGDQFPNVIYVSS